MEWSESRFVLGQEMLTWVMFSQMDRVSLVVSVTVSILLPCALWPRMRWKKQDMAIYYLT